MTRNVIMRICLLVLGRIVLNTGNTWASFTYDAAGVYDGPPSTDTENEADTSLVEVVEGFNASLPCSIHSPPMHDVPALTLWYIGDQETPVYSYDQREPRRSLSWADENIFGGGRARYLPLEHPPVLMLRNVTTEDQKLYRCRVDYHKSNSRQAWVKLTVIVPPSEIEILPHSSPVVIGQRNDVVCRVLGGSPLATVEWLQDGHVVDVNSTPSDAGASTYNSLEVAATRKDLTHSFTCKASNNKFTPPLTASFTRNVTCGPLSVSIVPEEKPLVAGRKAKLVCTVVGSNPPPLVTWYQQGQEITPLHTQVQVSENITVSSLLLEMSREHHGRQMVCRAEHPTLPLSTLEDIYTLDILYKPNVTLALGRSLDAKNLREGNDIFFECQVDANPPPYKVTWLHKGEELMHNVSAGVLVSESTLALQHVQRQRSGEYKCLASNVEGDSHSNSLVINIKYAPRCTVSPSLQGVALFELTNITCAVDADPSNVTFTWTFNNSVRRDQSQVVSEKRYKQKGLKSILSYTPMSERDYGTLLCFATNEVGKQKEPCSFTIISAGPPEEVNNCSVGNVTSHSAWITCLQGFDGGLPQRFLLQVWEMVTNELVVNTSGSAPTFYVKPLEAGRTYRAKVTAYNSRGLSNPSRLIILTLEKAEMHKSLPSMVPLSPSVFIMGVVAGVVVVTGALLLAAVWWVKRRRRNHAHSDSALSQIVLKDNNPDLISVEASEEGSHVRGNESFEALTTYNSMGHAPQLSTYQRYDEDDVSLYGSSSAAARVAGSSDVRNRREGGRSSEGGGGGRIDEEGRGGAIVDFADGGGRGAGGNGGPGGGGGGKDLGGRSGGTLGRRVIEDDGGRSQNFFVGESGLGGQSAKDEMSSSQTEDDLDRRHNTTVRLFRDGHSPEASL